MVTGFVVLFVRFTETMESVFFNGIVYVQGAPANEAVSQGEAVVYACRGAKILACMCRDWLSELFPLTSFFKLGAATEARDSLFHINYQRSLPSQVPSP